MILQDYLDAGIIKEQIIVVSSPTFVIDGKKINVFDFGSNIHLSKIEEINNSKFGIAIYEEKDNTNFRYKFLTKKDFERFKEIKKFEDFYNSEFL
ncbi:MAG: hypothetical protein ABIP51_16295 [Bacteroidia bacterium]